MRTLAAATALGLLFMGGVSAWQFTLLLGLAASATFRGMLLAIGQILLYQQHIQPFFARVLHSRG